MDRKSRKFSTEGSLYGTLKSMICPSQFTPIFMIPVSNKYFLHFQRGTLVVSKSWVSNLVKWINSLVERFPEKPSFSVLVMSQERLKGLWVWISHTYRDKLTVGNSSVRGDGPCRRGRNHDLNWGLVGGVLWRKYERAEWSFLLSRTRQETWECRENKDMTSILHSVTQYL